MEGTETIYLGNWYERTGGSDISYYHFGGRRVARRTSAGASYLHADHLNSTARTRGTENSGPQHYYPYGAMRGGTPVSTPYRYTGQREEEALGLYYYGARWYDPELRRFIQPDTIVPEPRNPQSLNRYSYVYNNPVNYTDPTGHLGDPDRDYGGGGHYSYDHLSSQPRFIPPVIRYIHRDMVRNAQGIVAALIGASNFYASVLHETPLGWRFKAFAFALWGSQVMDASIKKHLGPLAPLVANWDHKPILRNPDLAPDKDIPAEPQGWSKIGDEYYFYDTWSNIHYGYVGAASLFFSKELTGGAGLEQIGSTYLNKGHLPNYTLSLGNVLSGDWLAGWDDLSDTAGIQIGAALWVEHGFNGIFSIIRGKLMTDG